MKYKKIEWVLVISIFIFLYNLHISILNQEDFAYYMSGNKAQSCNLDSPKVSGDNISLEWYRTWGGQKDEFCGEETEYSMDIMTVDSLGNVYLVGTTESLGNGDTDICVVKYSSSGKQLWNTTWGGSNSEYGKSIAIDISGNIIILGTTQSWAAGDGDICVIKYTNLGILQWNVSWGSSEFKESAEEACGIEVDSDNNLYVAGSIRTSINGQRDFFVVKFNTHGAQVWNRTWGNIISDEWCYGIQIDFLGNIYLVGHGLYGDICLVKYDPFGDRLWNATWGGVYEERAKALEVGPLNNVYILGVTQEGMEHICIMKFNSTGSLQWDATWGQSLLDTAHSLKVISCQSIYISGITQNPGFEYMSYFLAHYNSSGVLQWNRTFERASYDISAIQADNEGRVYFGGTIAHNNQDVYFAMINSSGTIQYTSTWGESGRDISSMILF